MRVVPGRLVQLALSVLLVAASGVFSSASAQYYYGYGGPSPRSGQYSGRSGWQPGDTYAYPPGMAPDYDYDYDDGYYDGGPVRRVPRNPIYEPEEPRRGRSATAARLDRQLVDYDGREAPGTIVIDTRARYLYLVQPGGRALRYAVGVGREGFSWKGTEVITRKREWPDWRPPVEMLARRPDLPAHMPGGPDNPLGARALYLGNTLYRIHGSNEPETIGRAVSSGCIRMRNDDVIDLYERVGIGTRVRVI